jgi:hypothetical protein
MSEHFPILKEMSWVVADAKSLIKQGLAEGRVGPSQMAELEDLDEKLDSLLLGSEDLCSDYLDAEEAGVSPKLSDQEMVGILKERVGKAEELEARAKTILGSEY